MSPTSYPAAPLSMDRQTPLFFHADGRVDWVDVAKGLCIFFVVMMHSTLGVGDAAGATGWMHGVVAWAQPFRMPDFFFIAGLFLMKTIDAPIGRFVDRKIVHFAYFYLLWMVIQGVLKGGLLTGDIGAIPGVLLTGLYEPFGTLWFIYILPIFFVVTRLTRNVPIWVMLGIGAALEIAPISTGWSLFDEFCSRYVYFYAGYALAQHVFRMAEEVRAKPGIALLFLAGWAVVNSFAVFTEVEVLGEVRSLSELPFVSLVMGALGALAVVSSAALFTSSWIGKALAYMGSRSIVIYLAFFLPMVLTREVGIRTGLIPDVGTLSLLTTVLAVAAPLVGYWLIENVKPFGVFRFLFERPDWARTDRSSSQGRVSVAPAE